MLVNELLDKIETKQTPIYLHDILKDGKDHCYSRTATSAELSVLRNKPAKEGEDEELGVHLTNVDLQQIYDSYFAKNSVAVEEICAFLKDTFHISEEKISNAFVLFTILHEIGHWQHLIQSGLSRMDYWKKYEAMRDDLWIQFQFTYNLLCRTDDQRNMAFKCFNEKYRNLPSEKFADEYAITELPLYLSFI